MNDYIEISTRCRHAFARRNGATAHSIEFLKAYLR